MGIEEVGRIGAVRSASIYERVSAAFNTNCHADQPH